MEPPKWMTTLVNWMMPRSAAKQREDLRQRYTAPIPTLAEAGHLASRETVRNSKRAFDPVRFAGVAVLLGVAFLSMPGGFGLVAAAMTLALLTVREGRLHPFGEYVSDVLSEPFAVAAFAFIVLVAFSTALGTPLDVTTLVSETIFAAAIVSSWRLISYMKKLPYDAQPELSDLYHAVRRIDAMCWIAAAALCRMNTRAVPGGHSWEFWVTLIPILCINFSFKFQSGHGPLLLRKFKARLTLFGNANKEQTEIDADTLWQGGSRVGRILEIAFFLWMATPLAVAAWNKWAGGTHPVLWDQFAANIAAVATFFLLWTEIKKVNVDAVRAIHASIET